MLRCDLTSLLIIDTGLEHVMWTAWYYWRAEADQCDVSLNKKSSEILLFNRQTVEIQVLCFKNWLKIHFMSLTFKRKFM